MNPIKPKKIHEIYIAVSISEEIFFIDGCSSHLALSERDLRYVNIGYEISHRRIANKPKYQGSDWDLQDVPFYVELR
jgi:hypothetical protein